MRAERPAAPRRVRPRASAVLALLAAALLAPDVHAQFNQFGRFGKNKIIYKTFDWKIYRAPHFDVYYYPEEERFLEQIVSFAESAWLELSEALDHEPPFRIPLIYYKTHGDFEQTNITLEFIPESVGAFAEPLENRMVLPIDKPPDELYELLKHELVHIFEYSLLYGDLGRALRANTPLWLMEGLASHLARDESSLDRMIIRDAVVNGLVPPITKVRGLTFLTYRFGQAAFEFIVQEFGPEGLRTFLSEFRKVLLSGNIEKAIKESFGMDADEFDRKFQRFLRKRYIPLLLENSEPEDHGREIGIKLPGVFTFSPALSPSGDLIAVMTNEKEDLDVIVINAQTGEMVRNLTKGLTNDYDLVTAIFEGKNDLSWSPGGDEVAAFARRENRRVLLLFNAVTGKKVLDREIDVDEAQSPMFSPDGKKIVFAANREGQVDIFEYELESGTLTNITRDAFYDSNPSWSSDGTQILYNRRINAYEKIFLLDYADPEQKTQVTFGETSDIQPSFSRDGKRIYYASDGSEHKVFNIYSLDLETGEIRQYTDVISGHFSPQELAAEGGIRRLVSSVWWRGRYRLYTVDLEKPVAVTPPEQRVQEPGDIEPFTSALKLTVDESEKSAYDDLKFHLETVPTATVGVASDGTIYGNALLIFSDMLGDHRIWVNAQSVSSFTNFNVGYINMKHRIQHFYDVLDYRDYLSFVTASGNIQRQESSRITQARAGLVFPFTTFTKARLSGGILNREVVGIDVEPFQVTSGNDYALLAGELRSGTSPFFAASIINDTLRFKEFGPWHGKRVNLTVSTSPVGSGDLEDFTEYSLDARFYRKMTSRSLFAIRLATDVGTGDAPLFGIGGINQIRGFRFREFIGDQAAFLNLELRYPLVDELAFPFGSIRNVRGLLFFDVGAAWTQDGLFWDNETTVFREFKFYDSDENRLQDGRASYGLGFSFWMGFLELNWTFSRRLPYAETQSSAACDMASTRDPGESIFDVVDDIDQDCVLGETSDNHWRSDFWIGIPF